MKKTDDFSAQPKAFEAVSMSFAEGSPFIRQLTKS